MMKTKSQKNGFFARPCDGLTNDLFHQRSPLPAGRQENRIAIATYIDA
jgi:hypothetical protein